MSSTDMDPSLVSAIKGFQRNEMTEHLIYGRLARVIRNARNTEILERISREDLPRRIEKLKKEMFDAAGKLLPELAELAPKGDRRMSVRRVGGRRKTDSPEDSHTA